MFTAGFVVLIVAAIVALSFVDAGRHDGKVARNVTLAGADLGGIPEADARAEIDQLANRFSSIPVEVVVDDARISTNAGALGLQFRAESTLDELMAIGRSESGPTQTVEWIRRLFTPVNVPLAVDLDTEVAGSGLGVVAESFQTIPDYPSIEVRDGRIVGIDGTPGQQLDTAALLARLEENVPTSPDGAITLDAEIIDIPAALAGDGLVAYANQLNDLTDQPMLVTAGGQTKSIEPAMLRSWLRMEAPSNPLDGPLTALDEAAAQQHVVELFGDVSAPIDLSQITVVDKVPTLPGVTTSICCTADSGRRILDAIVADSSEVTLDLTEGGGNPLEAVGITDLLGEFTTFHPPGQDRNKNIDQMADIVRGAIVQPDETFSINGYVGRRTEERGFVPAGVIYNGVLTEDVGGGVSQFATTLFNAAFFAGLDFVEYQAHSLYFERYPYGREATVSFPEPDLVIRNTTPSPILIWTGHGSESVTVEIYGAPYATVTESGAWTEPVGACTKAITERTRTYPDKDPVVDTVFALYQPQEGLNCSGLPTTPPPECTAEEEAFDSNDTGFVDDCRPLPEGQLPTDTLGGQEQVPGELGACVNGQERVDTNNDGVPDTCQTSVLSAGQDPCFPQVGIDSDGNGFIDRCVNDD